MKINTRVKDINRANILWIAEPELDEGVHDHSPQSDSHPYNINPVKSNKGAYTTNPMGIISLSTTKYDTMRHTSVNINRQRNRGFIGHELPAKTSELVRTMNNSEVPEFWTNRDAERVFNTGNGTNNNDDDVFNEEVKLQDLDTGAVCLVKEKGED